MKTISISAILFSVIILTGQGCTTPPEKIPTLIPEPTASIINEAPEPIEAAIVYNNATSNDIQVTSPLPGQIISSPFEIIGQARGTWYFEAVAPVELVDINEQTISETFITAQGEWMTEDFVLFLGTLEFVAPPGPAILILRNDNPSGEPSLDKSIEIPVIIQ